VSFTLPTDPLPSNPRSTETTLNSLSVLKRAERLGTLNQVDRKQQYQGDEFTKPESLLKAVNEQGNHIRGVQQNVGKMQRDLYDLKLRNSLIVAFTTAVLMKFPELLAYLKAFFQ
jgi:hypothetical protein